MRTLIFVLGSLLASGLLFGQDAMFMPPVTFPMGQSPKQLFAGPIDADVNPDVLVTRYGADTFRMYEMFLGPVEQSKPWDTKGIEGVHRFLRKLWRLFFDETKGKIWKTDKPSDEEWKTIYRTIKKVEDATERFSFNTGVSALMIGVNELTDAELVAHAGLIVTGVVEQIEAVALADGGIVTRVTVGITRTIKGHVTGDTIVLTEPGGRVEDRLVWIFGVPEFETGENVLLFVRRRADGTFETDNLALGKYHLDGDVATRPVPVWCSAAAAFSVCMIFAITA